VGNLELDEGVSEVEASQIARELGLCEHVVGKLRKAEDDFGCGKEGGSVSSDERGEDGGRENAHVEV
jgi:hypothetical protein